MIDGEKNLIERAKNGESQAFGILYDAYQPQIYRFVYIKVSHKEEAEDITHQVFLNAWRKIDEYDERGFPFSSWLYRIARNQVIDHYRAKKEVVEIDILEETELELDIVEEADTKIATEKLMALIGKLSPVEQDVLILRFVEEKTHEEVGKAVGKTPLAVRLIQHRAIKRLKNILEKNGR